MGRLRRILQDHDSEKSVERSKRFREERFVIEESCFMK